MHYNEELANSKNLSASVRQKLDNKYEELYDVLYAPWQWNAPAAQITRIEFELQKLWEFTPDAKFHRYQGEIRGCRCPALDNAERYGHTVERVINLACPWHGKGQESLNNRKKLVDRGSFGK